MYGAVIGDLAGSIYEYDQYKNKRAKEIEVNNIIENGSFFSDDTVLTIAILDAILSNGDYSYYLKEYANKYCDRVPYDRNYFKKLFSPNFMNWVQGNYFGTSIGNGAMMRISPIGYLFDTEEEVIENVYLATYPSHGSIEAISAATKIALIIYYARCGLSKEYIAAKLDLIPKYRPFSKFNTTCNETIDNCLYAAFINDSFEDSIKEVISYGGDTDTNACITGSIAEALYGIDEELIKQANRKLPEDFINKLNEGYAKIKRL